MKLSEVWKNHKYIIFLLLASAAAILFLIVDNYIQVQNLKKEYNSRIAELQQLVDISNLGKSPETEFDIYQTAEDFLTIYYGVSASLSPESRKRKLEELMLQDADDEYGEVDYNNTLNYTTTISDIHIYVDGKNSTKERVYACIFFNENIDWNESEIDTIVLKKYWTGTFAFDKKSGAWKCSEITDCQELLTREEFNALNVDTNGSF